MSTIKVSKVEPVTSGGDCIVAATNIVGNKNLIINGAMQIAQRASSSTSTGYQTVDRFSLGTGGTNEAVTQAQHALTSSDTGPWEKGFRSSYHLTNGNQTSGADAADYVEVLYTVEAQDIANSGWDYNSTSSDITLSFWVRSSIAQTYHCYLQSLDGTAQLYAFSYAVSANTWTKVNKTIPGAANITFNNDSGGGLRIGFVPFYGTNYTASFTLNAWAAQTGSNMMPDNTSTWYTTNDSTFEFTGVQLEVGDVPTAYEHRKFSDELWQCQRYFCQSGTYGTVSADNSDGSWGMLFNAAGGHTRTDEIYFPREMKSAPTVTVYQENAAGGASSGQWAWYVGGSWTYISMGATQIETRGFVGYNNSYSGGSDGDTYFGHVNWKAESEL